MMPLPIKSAKFLFRPIFGGRYWLHLAAGQTAANNSLADRRS